ncbi:MAG: homoserine kinase [Polynucleobacter sp.]|jgi:homoserine kinase type II|nr:homoserine kinase [Polynucleobacter sp.]
MAVFTPLSLEELTPVLEREFAIGQVSDLRGIHGGIENSNFFLDTKLPLSSSNQTQYEYVITIFERLSFEQVPYYLELMLHLANKGIPVPKPIATRSGGLAFSIKDKPAAIVSKLQGRPQLTPTAEHCALVGDALGKMHVAGIDFKLDQPNLRSMPWWKKTVPLVLPHLNENQRALISSEMEFQTQFFSSSTYSDLPAGPCHCDLFRDNVMFNEGDQAISLGGFFDFYFAGTDKWLFDLAVTANDWCLQSINTEKTAALHTESIAALLNSYQATRPLSETEKSAWPAMLRAAALRFWISRLWDFYLPRNAQMLTPHDPRHFERILLERRKPSANFS